MDIYNYIKKDHETVSKLMEQIASSKDPKQRAQLFTTMCEELMIHAKSEEQTFYQALEERGGKQLQEKEEHAEEEHDEIESYIQQLNTMDPAEAKWLVTFGSLKKAVEHHVHEEEGEIFEKAKKVISDTQAERLADQMDQLKHEISSEAA